MNVVTVSDEATECRQCNQDQHIPKVYSPANNMNPGQVPSQLQVLVTMCCTVTTNYIILPVHCIG